MADPRCAGRRRRNRTIDGLAAVANGNGDDELVGIECKCRASPGTAQQAQDEENEYLGMSFGGEYPTEDMEKIPYYHVYFGDDEFKALITKNSEAIQLLHHAFTYDLTRVVLLIGNDIQLCQDVFVTIIPAQKSLYQDIL